MTASNNDNPLINTTNFAYNLMETLNEINKSVYSKEYKGRKYLVINEKTNKITSTENVKAASSVGTIRKAVGSILRHYGDKSELIDALDESLDEYFKNFGSVKKEATETPTQHKPKKVTKFEKKLKKTDFDVHTGEISPKGEEKPVVFERSKTSPRKVFITTFQDVKERQVLNEQEITRAFKNQLIPIIGEYYWPVCQQVFMKTYINTFLDRGYSLEQATAKAQKKINAHTAKIELMINDCFVEALKDTLDKIEEEVLKPTEMYAYYLPFTKKFEGLLNKLDSGDLPSLDKEIRSALKGMLQEELVATVILDFFSEVKAQAKNDLAEKIAKEAEKARASPPASASPSIASTTTRNTPEEIEELFIRTIKPSIELQKKEVVISKDHIHVEAPTFKVLIEKPSFSEDAIADAFQGEIENMLIKKYKDQNFDLENLKKDIGSAFKLALKRELDLTERGTFKTTEKFIEDLEIQFRINLMRTIKKPSRTEGIAPRNELIDEAVNLLNKPLTKGTLRIFFSRITNQT
ncbi:MAG: hypothetical protein H0W88_11390 [Parachlamydiaceae bacterium]|nr:hypothetical protein [Parachlamydiaceae bacterium]